MKKWMATLGLLGVVAPFAHADVGVVTRLDEEHATFRLGLSSVKIGEIVSMEVVPHRRHAVARGVVADVDPYTHRVIISLQPERGSRASIGAGGSATGRRYGNFLLNQNDTVRINSIGQFVENPPDYTLERASIAPRPTSIEIEMPRNYIPIPSETRGRSTPGPAAPPRGNMPNVDALLRSMPNGTDAGETMDNTNDPTPDAPLDTFPSASGAPESGTTEKRIVAKVERRKGVK